MSDQGGSFGNFYVNQNGVMVSDLTLETQTDPVADARGGRLFSKNYLGAAQLHFRSDDGSVTRLTGIGSGSGTYALTLEPIVYGLGEAEVQIASATLPSGAFKVAATLFVCGVLTGYLRLRDTSDDALLLEI